MVNRKTISIALFAVALMGLSGWGFGQLILPTPLTMRMVSQYLPPPNSAAYDYTGAKTIRGMVGRFAVSYFRFQINMSFARDRLAANFVSGDVTEIAKVVVKIKSTLITQQDFAHDPINIPSVISGLGWCDQVNGTAARTLSYFTGSAELIALVNANGVSPHSIGRIWSTNENRWIYFDIWPEHVILFSTRKNLDPNEKPEVQFLFTQHLGSFQRETKLAKLKELYESTLQRSRTMGTFDRNFIVQLVSNMSARTGLPTLDDVRGLSRRIRNRLLSLFTGTHLPRNEDDTFEHQNVAARQAWRKYVQIRLNYLWERIDGATAVTEINRLAPELPREITIANRLIITRNSKTEPKSSVSVQ